LIKIYILADILKGWLLGTGYWVLETGVGTKNCKTTFMFKIHEIQGHIQSIFIIEYADRLLLTDCGSRADFNKIKDFIENDLKKQMQDIKLAVVTHTHPDHVGLAQKLQKKYKIPVLAHPSANKWYSGFGGHLQHTIDIFLAWYVSIKQKNPPHRMWFPANLQADYLPQDGESLPFFNDWKVIYSPGHTAHDISLYHPETQTIYVGDVVLKIKNKYVLPMPVTLPGLMDKSLLKLSKLKIKNILLAHGGINKLEDSKIFFLQMREKLKTANDKMPALIRSISFFPPCIKNIKNC